MHSLSCEMKVQIKFCGSTRLFPRVVSEHALAPLGANSFLLMKIMTMLTELSPLKVYPFL